MFLGLLVDLVYQPGTILYISLKVGLVAQSGQLGLYVDLRITISSTTGSGLTVTETVSTVVFVPSETETEYTTLAIGLSVGFASVEENEAINIFFKFENGFYSVKDQTLPKPTKLSNLRILFVIYTKEIATQMTSNLEDFIYKKRSLDEMSIQSLKFCDIEKFKTLKVP